MAIGAELSPVARQRQFTNAGVVAAGAKLHAYLAGSLTPVDTYSDSALQSANANPVVASNSGLFGPIYLTPGQSYYFVCNESNDTTLIWDQDNVRGASTPQATSLTVVGSQNNLIIGQDTTQLRLNNATALTVTGITAGVAGQRLTIVSVGAGNVFLSPQDTNSAAANRLLNLSTGTTSPLAAGKGTAVYEYDGTTQRWRMITHDQGDWIIPTFDAAQFGSFTVESGDVVVNAYYLRGRNLRFACSLQTTTIAGTPATLLVTLPNGFFESSTVGVVSNVFAGNPSGTYAVCKMTISGATISLFPTIAGTGTWGTTTNTTALWFDIDVVVI